MLLVYGLNHHKTPIAIREKLSFDAAELPLALNSLMRHSLNHEAMILSTCNRTEIYTTAKNIAPLEQWLTKQKSLKVDLNQYCYSHFDQEAVQHIMRVASGLDSMVLGESQVLGQMKQAYFNAQNAGTVGVILNQLFPAVFSAAKCIRTQTDIGAHSVSIAYAITQFAKKFFYELKNCRVLLVGIGETIELVATYLHGIGVKEMIIANRTLEKSQTITTSMQAHAIRIQDIPQVLPDMDIVITATASQLPIIGKGLIETASRDKQNNPLLLFDLAVPRDIEPEAGVLPNVHLYNIDDLQMIIAHNKQNRMMAAVEAEKIIASQSALFIEKMRVFHARHIIAQYRERLEKMRDEEQEKALRLLRQGRDPEDVLTQFGMQLINKVMHHPTMKLREAASMEACDGLRSMKEFFEL